MFHQYFSYLELTLPHQILWRIRQEKEIDRVHNRNGYEYVGQLIVIENGTRNIRNQHAYIPAQLCYRS